MIIKINLEDKSLEQKLGNIKIDINVKINLKYTVQDYIKNLFDSIPNVTGPGNEFIFPARQIIPLFGEPINLPGFVDKEINGVPVRIYDKTNYV